MLFMKQMKVTGNEAGQRLDKLIIKYLNQASKSFIYKMIRKKNIVLNGRKADGCEKVKEGDEIKLFLSDETIDKFTKPYEPIAAYDLNIIYEDKNILILNKPAGMLSQKAKPEDASLNEHVLSYLLDTKQLSIEEYKSFRPGICNRLDRNTSGIVVAGKTLSGLQVVAELFKKRSISKYYQCIVKGRMVGRQVLEGYLMKDEKANKAAVYQQNMHNAAAIKTEYEPLASSEQYTLLKVKLITGRSHQIRAQLSAIGHPILGDSKYGSSTVNSYFRKTYGLKYQLLHSSQLIFPAMDGEFSYLSNKEAEAEIPWYFAEIQKDLFPNRP